MPKTILDDIQVDYNIFGKGQPLIFIHGAFVNKKMWQVQVEYFVDKGFQVITYDVRGHGETKKVKNGRREKKYSIDLFTRDLRRLIEKLEIKKPIICGVSMGGMIAQAYAAKYPKDLRALILSNTLISTEASLDEMMAKYYLAPKWKVLSEVRMFGVKAYVEYFFLLGQYIKAINYLGKDKEIGGYVKSTMKNFSEDEFINVMSAVYDFEYQDISNLDIPTMIITGGYEYELLKNHVNKFYKVIKDSTVSVISNSGHMPNLENPGEFNIELDDFLKRICLSLFVDNTDNVS